MLLAVSAVLAGFLPEKHIKKQGGKRAFLSISGPADQNSKKHDLEIITVWRARRGVASCAGIFGSSFLVFLVRVFIDF